jgi:hypothetical protein
MLAPRQSARYWGRPAICAIDSAFEQTPTGLNRFGVNPLFVSNVNIHLIPLLVGISRMLTPTSLQDNNLKEYDGFAHLCDGLCLEPTDVVAVLSAYFDESGTDASKPAVAVGCYVATVAQWNCFKADWRRLRRRSGVDGHFRRSDQESFWLHDDTKHRDKDWRTAV